MKIKPIYIVITVVVLVFGGFFFLFRNLSTNQTTTIPQQPIHWHPKLKIIINGEEQIISTGIGINIGKSMDYEISGMRMSPTHTHESDGTIHLENLNPRSKPETLTLGYFFYVWDKPFNSTCIFDYCTNNGTLTMYVNGQENNEFQNYLMRDKDEIVITYDSKD